MKQGKMDRNVEIIFIQKSPWEMNLAAKLYCANSSTTPHRLNRFQICFVRFQKNIND
jgi:hypothetical protein